MNMRGNDCAHFYLFTHGQVRDWIDELAFSKAITGCLKQPLQSAQSAGIVDASAPGAITLERARNLHAFSVTAHGDRRALLHICMYGRWCGHQC